MEKDLPGGAIKGKLGKSIWSCEGGGAGKGQTARKGEVLVQLGHDLSGVLRA